MQRQQEPCCRQRAACAKALGCKWDELVCVCVRERETDRVEMGCGGVEAGEVFGGQILNFSQS